MHLPFLKISVLLIAAAAAARADAAPKAEIDWVRIPGGDFVMGDEYTDNTPLHPVTIKAFDMARTLVTNKQYRACVAAKVCAPPDPKCLTRDFQGDDQPVVCVDWNQAKTFSEWIGGRLPSEAEWEYAARSAGKTRAYPWGEKPATCENAVINDGRPGCGRGATWPVCSKRTGNTAQGLCDMAGNAWEWVQDWFHGSYDGAPKDGSAWESPRGRLRAWREDHWEWVRNYDGQPTDGVWGSPDSRLRVRRGGSWGCDADCARAGVRGNDSTTEMDRFIYVGFRPARS